MRLFIFIPSLAASASFFTFKKASIEGINRELAAALLKLKLLFIVIFMYIHLFYYLLIGYDTKRYDM